MKSIYYFFIALSLVAFNNTKLSAQATNCFDSYLSPFCSGIAQYPANYDSTGAGQGPQAPAGPNYDCLGTQGNPTYFSLTIEQTGDIFFTLDNTANVDIDFILWGPFSGLSAAQAACDSMGQGGIWGNVDSCSYSGAPQEPVSISNAQAGDVYILMVTNFANVATNIFSTNNSGGGSIACPCDIPYIVDTLPSSVNAGHLADTTNNVNQFVVCPGNTLGFRVGARGNLNDTLSMYGPFTSINSAFANNTILGINSGSTDTLDIIAQVTPTTSEIGVRNFTIGMKNSIFTGGLTDSSCFDLLDVQVVVPGVIVSDRFVCSGDSFQIATNNIPTTPVGSSSYSWTQLSGPTVTFSSTTVQNPVIQIPVTTSTSSNDSIVIEVDYNYGGLCPMKDTMVLRFRDAGITASATPDSICDGQSTTLLVALSDTLNPPLCDDYEVNGITYAPVAGSGTNLSLSDDELSTILPIGFNFNFYCNDYSDFFISSNGFITFDSNSSSGCCAGEQLPTPGPFSPNALISMCWTDCAPHNGGTIEYFTTGTAPNRQLIVNFNNVPTLGSGSPQVVQAILFEGSNDIELHIGNATPSSSFNALSIGLENATGSIGHPIPGGSATQDSFSNVAFRFTQKTFGPFYSWSNPTTLSASDIYNPVATPTATTSYIVTVTDGSCSYVDTTTVVSSPTTLNINLIDTTNIGCDGTANTGAIDVTVTGGVGSPTFSWSTGASTEDIASLSPGTYTLTVTDAIGCSVSSPTYTITQATPVSVSITTLIGNLACDSLPIGSLQAVGTGGSNITYTWSNGTTAANATGLAAGTYGVTATNDDGCVDSTNQTINAPVVPTLDAYVSVTGMTNVSIPTGSSVSVFAGNTNFSYNWTGIAPAGGALNIADALQASTSVSPDPDGNYTYIVTASATTNDTTCTATDTVWVTVEPPFQGIPNAFTPNSDDDVNKYFRPVTLSDAEIQVFRVYNRWGQEVYNGDETQGSGWDGTYLGVPQAKDVYVYVLVYQRGSDPEPITVRGEVTLIR